MVSLWYPFLYENTPDFRTCRRVKREGLDSIFCPFEEAGKFAIVFATMLLHEAPGDIDADIFCSVESILPPALGYMTHHRARRARICNVAVLKSTAFETLENMVRRH